MAILKVGTKTVNGIANLSIADYPEDKSKMVIRTIGFQGNLDSIVVPKYNLVRVELRLDEKEVIPEVRVGNCLTVFGNIENAKVGNCLTVEGFVKDYNNSKGISVDRTIKVTYGAERLKRNNSIPSGKIPHAHVIKIQGKLLKLTIDVSNVSIEPVIFGNVNTAYVSNCLEVKGTVSNCKVGNVITCTMGKSRGLSTEEIVKTRKSNESLISDLFKDMEIFNKPLNASETGRFRRVTTEDLVKDDTKYDKHNMSEMFKNTETLVKDDTKHDIHNMSEFFKNTETLR